MGGHVVSVTYEPRIQKQNTSVDLFVHFGPPVILHNKLIRGSGGVVGWGH